MKVVEIIIIIIIPITAIIMIIISLERPRRRWENNIKMDLRKDRPGSGLGHVAVCC
jgi:hypothetical protein